MKAKKLAAGDVFPVSHLQTIKDKEILLKNSSGLIHLSLARHSGCLFCNYAINQYSQSITKLQKENIKTVFVFQSNAKIIIANQGEAPWSKNLTFVADPSRSLYLKTGAEASAWKTMMSLPFLRSKNFQPIIFKDTGTTGRNQMPADFLIDTSTGVVLASKYGERTYDRWTVEDVLEIASKLNVLRKTEEK